MTALEQHQGAPATAELPGPRPRSGRRPATAPGRPVGGLAAAARGFLPGDEFPSLSVVVISEAGAAQEVTVRAVAHPAPAGFTPPERVHYLWRAMERITAAREHLFDTLSALTGARRVALEIVEDGAADLDICVERGPGDHRLTHTRLRL